MATALVNQFVQKSTLNALHVRIVYFYRLFFIEDAVVVVVHLIYCSCVLNRKVQLQEKESIFIADMDPRFRFTGIQICWDSRLQSNTVTSMWNGDNFSLRNPNFSLRMDN